MNRKIDIETADFELDKSEIVACDRLEARQPDAQSWIVCSELSDISC